jgi:hypothetical protein
VPIAADTLPDDLAALKRMIAAMAPDALVAQAEIARLKFQLARYRRAEFGRSSEKLARQAEPLELALEAREADQAERLARVSPEVAAIVETAAEAQKPARRPLPKHLPREDWRHPAPCTCPGCGGALRKIADAVSETLDYVPGRFKSLPSRKRGSSGAFARNCRAGPAIQWSQHRRRITRLPAAAPGRGCSPISSCRKMTIPCRSIARPRSLPATA